MNTKLLQSLALGLAFGVANCGSSDNSPLFTGEGETGGANGGTGGSATGSGGSSSTTGGGDNAGGDENGSGQAGTSTGGSTTTGGGGSRNTGMGGNAGSGNAGSGGAPMGGTGGHAGSGGGSMGGAGGGAGSGAGGGPNACTPTAPLPAGTQHCSSNASGNVAGGYSYTIWSSGTGGCVTPYGVGAAFKATWNNSGDFLARVGLAFNSTKTPDQIGTFSADYAETKTGTDGGASFIGIYGWSEEPLHEYYIVDDWFGSRPNWGEKVGTVTLDGGTYDILTHTQVNQPSISGTATFVQFWSMRQTPRQCGHISISEHFKAWANMGMTLGKMEECKVVVEVVGGSGNIDFPVATLVAK